MCVETNEWWSSDHMTEEERIAWISKVSHYLEETEIHDKRKELNTLMQRWTDGHAHTHRLICTHMVGGAHSYPCSIYILDSVHLGK